MKVIDLQRNLSHQILNTQNTAKIRPSQLPGSGQPVQRPNDPAAQPFSEVFQKTLQEQESVKFSAHAMKRLEDRNIELSGSELQRLNEGVEKIGEKGGRNSVILIDDNAYVVSIANKTVVTTMAKDFSSGNVFTNIDSVLIN